MQHERENLNPSLTAIDYNIGGNELRAYYDDKGALVFVLDYATDDIKPNVLLVINPVGERKWDDILTNDFGVDLETVRPKKDNKYQKLDIEYDGLGVYDALISAFKAHGDVNAELKKLGEFRRGAALRSAQERLAAAEEIAENARETIDKAYDAAEQLQAKLKNLRAKLTSQRREIGKEPTKQSAAKILRTESQIDAVTEKLNRANKRRANAQKRLAMASDDADVARDILAMLAAGDDIALPAAPVVTDVAAVKFAPVLAPMGNDDNSNITDNKPQVEKMADDEVKPLFDTDPNILDDEIAFKPVEFGADIAKSQESEDKTDDAFLPQPLQFTPPAMVSDDGDDTDDDNDESDAVMPVPVLDSLTAVDSSEDDTELDDELMPSFAPVPVVAPETIKEPVAEYVPQPVMPEYDDEPDDEPQEDVVVVENVVAPVAPMARPVSPIADAKGAENAPSVAPVNPMPEIAVAPVDSGFRPVSPIADAHGDNNAVVSSGVTRAKPAALYYVMLIALIVLSIFTLWIYQRSVNDNLPELGAKSVAEPEVVAPVVEPVEEPVAEPIPVPMPITMETEPVVEEEPVAEPEPVIEPVVEPEPVVEAPVEEVVPVEDIEPESPFMVDDVVDFVPVEPVPDVIVNKPEYSVSPQDKPVVMAPEYEDTDVAPVVEYDAGATVVPVEYDAEPEYYAPDAAVVPVEYDVQESVAETENYGACSDGSAPDVNGCCPGENFMNIGGQPACCDEMSGDCFPPIQ